MKKKAPAKLTRYAYAKKHKVSSQLIYMRVQVGTIPVDENGLIDSDFPFKRYLKCGRKPLNKKAQKA